MNADLERTVGEMGAEYRAVVERMLAPFGGVPPAAGPESSPCEQRRGRSPRPAKPAKPSKLSKPFLFVRPLLVAASLLLVCIFASQLLSTHPTSQTTARPESSPYQASQTCGRLRTTAPRIELARVARDSAFGLGGYPTFQTSTYTLAYSASSSAIAEIVRTQGADGGWGSDFLTRQNAAALRGVADAGVPYRRALRYLRARGLAPLTDDELRMRARAVEG